MGAKNWTQTAFVLKLFTSGNNFDSNGKHWWIVFPFSDNSGRDSLSSPVRDTIPTEIFTRQPRGPGDRKIHSRSNAWKNHSPTHEIFILAWNFHARFEMFILDWKFQSQTLFFCGQRGARNENFILDGKFHSVLKAWIFQDCLSRLDFFNPRALWEIRQNLKSATVKITNAPKKSFDF